MVSVFVLRLRRALTFVIHHNLLAVIHSECTHIFPTCFSHRYLIQLHPALLAVRSWPPRARCVRLGRRSHGHVCFHSYLRRVRHPPAICGRTVRQRILEESELFYATLCVSIILSYHLTDLLPISRHSVLAETGGVGAAWIIDDSSDLTARSTSSKERGSAKSRVMVNGEVGKSGKIVDGNIPAELLATKTAMLAASLNMTLGNYEFIADSEDDEDVTGVNYEEKFLNKAFAEKMPESSPDNSLHSDDEDDSGKVFRQVSETVPSISAPAPASDAAVEKSTPQSTPTSIANDNGKTVAVSATETTGQHSISSKPAPHSQSTHSISVADLINMLSPGGTLVLSRAIAFDIPESQQLLLRSATVIYNTPISLLLGGTSFMHIAHDVLALIDDNPPEWLKCLADVKNNVNVYPLSRVKQAFQEANKGSLVSIMFEE